MTASDRTPVAGDTSRHRFTPWFAIEEFDCHDGTKVPREAVNSVAFLVLHWLTDLRREFGPVKIISGYRTVSHNAHVGGVAHSVHLLKTPLPGRPKRSRTVAAAADVTIEGTSPQEIRRWARAHVVSHPHLGQLGRGGIGFYPVSGFVHLDTGERREWDGR